MIDWPEPTKSSAKPTTLKYAAIPAIANEVMSINIAKINIQNI
jgi:hypothetical protein